MATARASSRRVGATASLKEYRRKRDLSRSGEPAGATRTAPASAFVIQKHAATRLHYDFRLEADDVLKSWAVPKGLPTKPGTKALAVEVEDHPLDYGGFEGTIPEGNYGAGTVMLWDRGMYAVEGGDFKRAYRAGKLHVALAGEKVRGAWTLVRLRPRGRETKTNWLLIKNQSSARLPRRPTKAVARDVSVLTGRTMAEITAGKQADRGKKRTAKRKDDDKTEAAPEFLVPMKALGVDTIPSGDWHLEIKLDGYRAVAAVSAGGPAQLWSRNQRSFAADYPEVVAALGRLGCQDALLDGEIVALDAQGRSRFQLLQQLAAAVERPAIYYYVFDLLRLDGRSYVDKPLEQRRAALEKLMAGAPEPLRLSPGFKTTPAKLLRQVQRLGLEGIVAKTPGSRYEAGRRSGAWLKCRVSSEQEFVIGGFSPPGGGRRYFGALLLGYYDGKKLKYAGKVGTGFDERHLAELHGLMVARPRRGCPFVNLPSGNGSRFGEPMNAATLAKMTWVRPELVCQIRFAEWTEEGRLRHPVYLGLRRDKLAREVVREAPAVKASA